MKAAMRAVAERGVVTLENPAFVADVCKTVRRPIARLRGAWVQACQGIRPRLMRPPLQEALPTLSCMVLGAAGDLDERLEQLAEEPTADHRAAVRDGLVAQMRALLLVCDLLEISPDDLLIEIANGRPHFDPTRDLLERCRAALTLGLGPRVSAADIQTARTLREEIAEALRGP